MKHYVSDFICPVMFSLKKVIKSLVGESSLLTASTLETAGKNKNY